MSLKIETSRIDGEILLVRLSGSLTRWGEQSLDEPWIHDFLCRGEKKLIVDLSGIGPMDSSGVQLLYECFAAARSAGGELRLVGANTRVARLFQITRLNTVLPFHLTIASACEGFRMPGTGRAG
ncbi:MAG: STAS domain-containing protein [Acidobacteriia bacterium]|nr:STAS domain-containing protein [Terriglobia bacterium]